MAKTKINEGANTQNYFHSAHLPGGYGYASLNEWKTTCMNDILNPFKRNELRSTNQKLHYIVEQLRESRELH